MWVNSLKKSIFLCLLFEFFLFGCYSLFMHLWELLIVFSYCHRQENTPVFVFFSRFLDILKNNYESDQRFHILCGTKLYLCILNPILMLEHALTEYYVSICFVHLLYSNCLLPEGKWWNQVYIFISWKLNWIRFKCYVQDSFICFKNLKYFPWLHFSPHDLLAYFWKQQTLSALLLAYMLCKKVFYRNIYLIQLSKLAD